MKPRDTRENIRLSKIALAFCELARIKQFIEENLEHEQFLLEFMIIPIRELKNLKIDKAKISQFVADNTQLPLKLQFIESFRQTQSRRFWE